MELAISGVEENLAIRERSLSFVKLAWSEGEPSWRS
jgi:hypothetical protein